MTGSRTATILVACAAVTATLTAGATAVVPGPVTTRISVTNAGAAGNGGSGSASVSGDGRYVAFTSDSSNLVSGDTNDDLDVFVRDRQASTLRRVSVSTAGVQGNGSSRLDAISRYGRYVVFSSDATNLVPGDTNGAADVFVRDRQTGTTTRVSVSTAGKQADLGASGAAISADGRYVAFASFSTDLVAGDTNHDTDVFVRDRQTGTTTRVSVSSSGAQAGLGATSPAISADGRYVAFTSAAANLVTGDTNRVADVFVRDRTARTTRRVSVSSRGVQADLPVERPAVSGNGRFVVFETAASTLVPGDTNGSNDVFLRDLQTGTTRRVSVSSRGVPSDGDSIMASISADGRYVAFASTASTLAPDTPGLGEVYVHDRQLGTTTVISVTPDGIPGQDDSYGPAISADGRYVAFTSEVALVPGPGSYDDVYLRGPLH